MPRQLGVVGAGHRDTAQAARLILEAGGNAFDAALGALATACVAEPVLASLGGGGFLLAHTHRKGSKLYDFFVQTPRRSPRKRPLDFRPIIADFGPVQQEFHIGMGAIATPGLVKGIFAVHEELGSLPLRTVFAPAIELARKGVQLNAFQSHIFEIVAPIYQSNPAAQALCANTAHPTRQALEGDYIGSPALADTLEALAYEGDALFYHGEIARALVADCAQHGGLLELADLAHYQVIERTPLALRYGDALILGNPPPSVGGLLIGFALRLLEHTMSRSASFGSVEHLVGLVEAMRATQQARLKHGIDADPAGAAGHEQLLQDGELAPYRDALREHLWSLRGTTHISVIDRQGELATLSVSNGEGSGYVIRDTGIMTNNMLGEADLHPQGFHRWIPNRRMVSMMAPSTILWREGRMAATGSGGSNRIRTTVLQVLMNLLTFGMPVRDAVHAPRLHYESGFLNLEAGFPQASVEGLCQRYPQHKCWPDRHLFFGGAHSAVYEPAHRAFDGAGDLRRGGESLVAYR